MRKEVLPHVVFLTGTFQSGDVGNKLLVRPGVLTVPLKFSIDRGVGPSGFLPRFNIAVNVAFTHMGGVHLPEPCPQGSYMRHDPVNTPELYGGSRQRNRQKLPASKGYHRGSL